MSDDMRVARRGFSLRGVVIICVAAAVLVALGLWGGYSVGKGGGGDESAGTPGQAAALADTSQIEFWTCAMHPQIRQPGPGKCPICAMDLIPVTAGGGGGAAARELMLSPEARKLAEIVTAPVERRLVAAEVRLAGKIQYDETRVSNITAWVPGRLERMYVDYTGATVRRGDPMVSLYSPELLAAQEELLQSLKAAGDLKDSGIESLRRTAAQTVEAARKKLRLWGLSPEQVSLIEQRGTATDRVDILAPAGGVVVRKSALQGQYVTTGTHIYTIADLSRVWVELDAYESDLPWIHTGQTVEFSTEAYPGETFAGQVVFIDPVVDPGTRTARVRVNLDNPDGKLKPEMFVRAVLRAEVARDSQGRLPLVIPASAPLITGRRAVVYLEEEPGLYRGTEVVLGPRAGDFYVVEDGLEEGQRVVTRGNFKIDSAIQIMAGPSMMSPEEGGEPGTPAAFKASMDDVYTAYLEIHHGLSRDTLEEGRAGAAALIKATEAVDMSVLSHPAHQAYMGIIEGLKEHAEAIASAADISSARTDFAPLSEAMYALLKQFGTSGIEPVRRFHCSMAFDNLGANWLQRGTEVENPYWGSAMFRCGDITETLVGAPSPVAEGHSHE
jgi:Cu(I)/Ag(I) efflux system membrane fusion protein